MILANMLSIFNIKKEKKNPLTASTFFIQHLTVRIILKQNWKIKKVKDEFDT